MAAENQRSTVVGVFEDRAQADKAVAELMKAGFRQEQIGVAMRHAEGSTSGTDASDVDDSDSGSGAMTGAIAGLGLGALAGLGVLAGVIPVVGPAIAAGTLGVILSNAAAGAGVAGLVGALVGSGLSEHEAEYYHGEFEAGRAIVTVTADARADEATTILRQYGAYDMSNKGSSTPSATEYAVTSAAAATTTPRAATTHATGHSAGDTIEV